MSLLNNRRLCLRLPVCLIALCVACGAVSASPFSPPDLEGFILHTERDADGDGDGVNETRIRQYLNPQGDSIVSMSSAGRVWAWSLDSRDSESGDRNYVIRDGDCDGSFEEIYSLDDEFHVPACLKEQTN